MHQILMFFYHFHFHFHRVHVVKILRQCYYVDNKSSPCMCTYILCRVDMFMYIYPFKLNESDWIWKAGVRPGHLSLPAPVLSQS